MTMGILKIITIKRQRTLNLNKHSITHQIAPYIHPKVKTAIKVTTIKSYKAIKIKLSAFISAESFIFRGII